MVTIVIGQSLSDTTLLWWACGIVLTWATGMWWIVGRPGAKRA